MPLLSTITDRNPLDSDEPLFLDEPENPAPARRRSEVDVETLFRDEPLPEIQPASWTAPAAEARRFPLALLFALAAAIGFAIVAALLF